MPLEERQHHAPKSRNQGHRSGQTNCEHVAESHKGRKIEIQRACKTRYDNLIESHLIPLKDKERYLNELKELTKSAHAIDRPKKPLTPYMLFVRAVSS